jgi:hypothetical protein
MNNALYYPHIAFKNPDWIKSMALYYDNVYRIVPSDVVPDDPDELKPLLEEGCIGKKIDPAKYAKETSEVFLKKSSHWNAAALSCKNDEKEPITRLHMQKTDEQVRELFHEVGFTVNGDWINVPTSIAYNFMLYMANEIASKNNLSLITGEWAAWTGTSYFGLNGKVDEFVSTIGTKDYLAEEPEKFGLYGLFLDKLTPVMISDIPSEKIVEFRQKRKDEIGLFRQCMADLRNELIAVESSEIRMDIIQEKANALVKAQKDFQKSAVMIGIKKWGGVSIMGFPALKLLSQWIPSSSLSILTATGLAISGICTINSIKEEIKKLKKETPASFLVEFKDSFKDYTWDSGRGGMNVRAYKCMKEYVDD